MSENKESYQVLIEGKGETVVDGKTHWKDFIQVRIDDPRKAFELAMDILRQVEPRMYSEGLTPITFALTGSLEPEED